MHGVKNVLFLMLLTAAPQHYAKPVRITHTNIGVYESRIDCTRLTQRERMLVMRSIERYYRPRPVAPHHQWQIDAVKSHEQRMQRLFAEVRQSGMIVERLGFFDDWARDVRLSGFWIINTQRPD